MTFHYGKTWHTYQTFTYIRKDLLDRFLSDTGTRLIYVIWGRREFYSANFGERESFAEEHTSYERFEYVRFYEPSQLSL